MLQCGIDTHTPCGNLPYTHTTNGHPPHTQTHTPSGHPPHCTRTHTLTHTHSHTHTHTHTHTMTHTQLSSTALHTYTHTHSLTHTLWSSATYTLQVSGGMPFSMAYLYTCLSLPPPHVPAPLQSTAFCTDREAEGHTPCV